MQKGQLQLIENFKHNINPYHTWQCLVENYIAKDIAYQLLIVLCTFKGDSHKTSPQQEVTRNYHLRILDGFEHTPIHATCDHGWWKNESEWYCWPIIDSFSYINSSLSKHTQTMFLSNFWPQQGNIWKGYIIRQF